jgi:hypothetical protein
MKERINHMKKLNTLLAIIIGTIVFIVLPAIADTYQSYYTQYGEVYLCDINETLIVDATGNIWSISATDEFNEGETVKIKFYTNHTDYTREDDEIISIKRVD